MSQTYDVYSNGYETDLNLRIQSNCLAFQKTGKSPQKLDCITVEWYETFKIKDSAGNIEYEYGCFQKCFQHPVHARSFAIALVLGQTNSSLAKLVNNYEGEDYHSASELGEVQDRFFGNRTYKGTFHRYVIMEWEFDFSKGANNE
jgi:hypothetical protein